MKGYNRKEGDDAGNLLYLITSLLLFSTLFNPYGRFYINCLDSTPWLFVWWPVPLYPLWPAKRMRRATHMMRLIILTEARMMINMRITNLMQPDLRLHSWARASQFNRSFLLPTGKQCKNLLLIISILTLQCKMIDTERLGCFLEIVFTFYFIFCY